MLKQKFTILFLALFITVSLASELVFENNENCTNLNNKPEQFKATVSLANLLLEKFRRF